MPDTTEVSLPKPKRFKWLKRVALVLVLLVVIAVGGARIMLPSLIKDQIEKQGTDYLKTPVTVGSVNLGLMRGSATINDLSVKNYEGFAQKNIIQVKEAGANISLASLLTKTIVIDKITLKGSTTNSEVNADGIKNLQMMMDRLNEKLNPPKEQKPPSPEKTGGKKAESKGLLLKELDVQQLAINFEDHYSQTQMMSSSTGFAKFVLTNVAIPAEGEKAGSRVMTVKLNDYQITGNDGFTKRTFLSVPETSLDMDLGKLMDSKNEMVVHILKLEHKGLDFVAEDTDAKPSDDSMPENIRQFLHIVMNNLPGNEVRRYQVASNENDSTDWYASMVRKDVKEKNPDGKADEVTKPAKKSKKVEPNTDTKDDVETVPAVPPSVEPSKKKNADKSQLASFVMDEMDLESMRFEFIRPQEKYAKDVVFDNVNVKMTKFVQPYVEGTESTFEMSCVPQGPPAIVKVDAKGGLTDKSATRNVVGNMTITQFPLATLPKMRDGVFSSKADMTIKDSRAVGTVSFNLKNFQADNIGQPWDKMMPMITLASRLELPDVKVPYSISLKDGKSWNSFMKDLFRQIVKGLPVGINESINAAGAVLDSAGKEALKAGAAVTEQVGALTDNAAEALGSAGKVATEGLSQGKDALQGTAEGGKKAVEGATSTVKDAGASIGSGIKGILGGNKNESDADKNDKK